MVVVCVRKFSLKKLAGSLRFFLKLEVGSERVKVKSVLEEVLLHFTHFQMRHVSAACVRYAFFDAKNVSEMMRGQN
jgi:hypothetical protein